MKTIISITCSLIILIIAYDLGRKDYTNELAVTNSIVKHYKKEIQFFYDKWIDEHLAHSKTQLELEKIQAELEKYKKLELK